MALPLAAGLLGFLGLGHMGNRAFEDSDRGRFEEGFRRAAGRAPSLFEQQPNDFEGVMSQNYDPGEGFLADPDNKQNQMAFISDLFGLRGGRDLAEQLTADVFEFGQRDREAAAGREFTAGENEKGRMQQIMENERDRRNQSRIANDKLLSQEYFKALDLAKSANDQTQFGLPGDSQMRRVSTGAGAYDFVDVPKPGTPQWREEFLKTKSMERSITNVDNMMEMFESTGSFETGRESGQLTTMHAAALMAMREAFDLKVLSDSDLEFLESVFVDPQTIAGNLATSNNRIKGGYEEGLKLLQQRLTDQNASLEHWGITSGLDKTTPSQARRAAERKKRDQKMAAMGGNYVESDVQNPSQVANPDGLPYQQEWYGPKGGFDPLRP